MMLSTLDNPYNPKHDYVKWLQWDSDQHYYTQEYLNRIADLSPSMTDVEEAAAIEQAIYSILDADVLGIYWLVG